MPRMPSVTANLDAEILNNVGVVTAGRGGWREGRFLHGGDITVLHTRGNIGIFLSHLLSVTYPGSEIICCCWPNHRVGNLQSRHQPVAWNEPWVNIRLEWRDALGQPVVSPTTLQRRMRRVVGVRVAPTRVLGRPAANGPCLSSQLQLVSVGKAAICIGM